MDADDLCKLFFELASESRLSILKRLDSENLKMQEIARLLDITATETFRQLERLSTASLVERLPEGNYTLTQYGRLILKQSSSYQFLARYRDYFSTHNLSALPTKFMHRLGELSRADFLTDTMEAINKGEKMFLNAQKYGWGFSEGVVPELMASAMTEKLIKGIEFKFIIPNSRLPKQSHHTPNLEMRGIPEVPFVIAVTEKEGVACFRLNSGKMDYSAFHSTDTEFLEWGRELFLHFWERTNRV